MEGSTESREKRVNHITDKGHTIKCKMYQVDLGRPISIFVEKGQPRESHRT